ncbi:sterol desaturase family protein, partial [Mycobacterium tuberculosis]|nr:sterol desaturase family protein [Mycobacterium tuberculosis]
MPTELMTWLHAFLGNDVDWKQVLLIGMTPVFLIAFAIEYAVMTGRGRREPFRWKEIVANLSLGAGYQ